MAHSPGEWKVEEDENGDTFVRIPGHDIFIANIEGACGVCYDNARLIAAAPALLEALEHIREMAEEDIVLDLGGTNCHQIEANARAAIQKARGE